MTMIYEAIASALMEGQAKTVRNLVRQALSQGCSSEDILQHGLLKGMEGITKYFKDEKVYVPEVLVAVHAMNAGTDALERFGEKKIEMCEGKVVIGTVEGDLHDIGKNLVAMMLRSNGFEVYDLGVDVDERDFINKAEEVGADIIIISAMLTTTMARIQDIIGRINRMKLRHKYAIMIGGAPVTAAFAQKVGADYYSDDAGQAVDVAKKIMEDKKRQELYAQGK